MTDWPQARSPLGRFAVFVAVPVALAAVFVLSLSGGLAWLDRQAAPIGPAFAASSGATHSGIRSTDFLKTDLFYPPPRVLAGTETGFRAARPVRETKAALDWQAIGGALIAGWQSRAPSGDDMDGNIVTGSIAPAMPLIRASMRISPVLEKLPGESDMARLATLDDALDRALNRAPAWRRFAAPAAYQPGHTTAPLIAIVLDDLGPDVLATRRAIAMAPTITLSFLPYAPHVSELADEARALGHEILAHVPMEPYGNADPGRNALMLAQSEDEFKKRLDWNLNQFDGYVGINNHMGSRLTEQARPMLTLMAEMQRRDLLFLDSRTTAQSLGSNMAKASGVPALERDIFLDHAQGPDHLLSQLFELERVAQANGVAIAIGHPHPLTLDVLEIWSRGIESKGLRLAPLTALLRAPSPS